MQKSGFFNALNNGVSYDRTYNADDYSENLATIISTGVLQSVADDLKVTSSGMACSVGAGRAWINGKWYKNDSIYTFDPVNAPITGKRYDRVFLRFDNTLNVRDIFLVYRQGTAASNPAKPAPVRTNDVYELALADVYVDTNATSVVVTDLRGDETLCPWLYSVYGSVMFRKFGWRKVLTSSASSVTFDIPQYDPTGVDIIEVYVNGLLEFEGIDYTLSGSTITFSTLGGGTGKKIAGTEIVVMCLKSIDASELGSVADTVETLQNQIAGLATVKSYDYACTGTADNVAISDIAQSFINRTGAYSADAQYGQLTIRVHGKCGVQAAHAGNGTSSTPYRWFSLGSPGENDKRRVIVDFSCCDMIDIPLVGNTNNVIFYGQDVRIKGVNIHANCNAAGCKVDFFNGRAGTIYAENCYFKSITTDVVLISRSGNFISCEAHISNSNGHAYCFLLSNDSRPPVVIGGRYRAYTASALDSNISAVVYGASTQAGAGCVLQGVSIPTVAWSPYYQKYAILANSGNITANGIMTTLPITTTGSTASITGTLPISR